MKITFSFLLLTLSSFICANSYAQENSVRLHHTHTIQVNENKVNELWNYIKTITSSHKILPPHIYFISFNAIEAGSAWTQWQTQWVVINHVEENPPWWLYDGFYYKGTRVIQVSPELFIKKRTDAKFTYEIQYEGMIVIAHEMLHYIFDQKKVPSVIHHCVMDKGDFQKNVASFVYKKPIVDTPLTGICEKIPSELIKKGIDLAHAKN